VCGDQPCAGTGGGCGVEKWWLRISRFCSEDCRLLQNGEVRTKYYSRKSVVD
jgi:hypothetical protein